MRLCAIFDQTTHDRQRQYFEQKRRQQQQQRPELQNQDNVAGGQASRDQEPRSLDVLNINNLATSLSHHNESASEFLICFGYWGLRFQWRTLFFSAFIILPFYILSVVSGQVNQVMSLAEFSYDDCFYIMLDADGAMPQVDCTLSDGSPTEAIRKITYSNMKEAGKGAVSVHQSRNFI